MNIATSSQSSKKRGGLGPDRSTTACKEMEELTKAGILRKVKHQTWVANPVMNTRATYQRLVDKVFHDQIRRNLEAYVDDMVIKSTSEEDMLADSKETLERFRSINMKLNPKKCSFGVEEGPFLGHLITKQGIRANPSKVPSFLQNTQKLHRQKEHTVDARSRSITPRNEEICGGLANAHNTDARIGSDNGAEINYPALEKLILALVHTAKRLRRYFQAHTVTVLTDLPIKQKLTKLEKSGRVAKLAIELGEHDIMFRKRGDDKKEMAKDFLIEVPFEDKRKETGGKKTRSARLMLIDPEGKEYTYALRFEFETTNNEAEYEALMAGLRIAHEMEIVSLEIFVDSQLLVNQIKGTYAAKQPTIKEYMQKTKEALKGFDSYMIKHIRRNQNKKAGALSKLASMTFEHLTKEVLIKVLAKRSIKEKAILQVETKEDESWMTPIHEYLVSGLLLEDLKEARKIRVKAPQYKLIRGSLY
ncbi:reverse transcriptase domain-containing protein [Tanacetum coccineum]|uniref:Reverse transcriptase domain-containing protein n=1 Tax=Tanacetum coccineum TaxID=301880 RepID=A0ABQ5DVE1_9ASTR